MNKIGFMQGRLSPMIDNKIQCFPWGFWEDEFISGSSAEFSLIEWTIDHDRFHENPLNTKQGQERINSLIRQYKISVPSVTGDCFMQQPFYKAIGKDQENLLNDFRVLCKSVNTIGGKFIVIPLVDNGALKSKKEEDTIVSLLLENHAFFKENKVQIIFESDYIPKDVLRFITRLPEDTFGINFDSGNSAALGFNSNEEFALFGHRILNIHIKDRILGGTTVPLGEGNCHFNDVFKNIKKIHYQGNIILQTARAKNNDHLEVLVKYKKFVEENLK